MVGVAFMYCIYFLLSLDVQEEGPFLGVAFVNIIERNEHMKF